MARYVLMDMVDDPDFDPYTNNNRGDWSLRDVSSGQVFADKLGKPACIDHHAMNAVNPTMSIWRCLMCGRSAYTRKEGS